MSVRVYRASPPPPRVFWAWLLAGLALLAMICLVVTAVAQVKLPEVVVRAAKPKPKPAAAAHVRPAPAPAARVAPAPAGYAGRAARRQDDRPQPGPQYHLRADGDGADHDQPQHHRGAAAGRERNGREDRAAVSRSYPGFRRRRQFPCAQRARQCADSHQRHHASGRRQRLWHVPRHCLDRQYLPDYRRTAAAIRPAHLRRPRHPDAQRRLQQYRQRRHLRRQPGNVYAKHRIRRHRRTDAILCHRPLLREQYRPGKSDAELERHPRPHRRRSEASATSRPCSTPTPASPS